MKVKLKINDNGKFVFVQNNNKTEIFNSGRFIAGEENDSDLELLRFSRPEEEEAE